MQKPYILGYRYRGQVIYVAARRRFATVQSAQVVIQYEYPKFPHGNLSVFDVRTKQEARP